MTKFFILALTAAFLIAAHADGAAEKPHAVIVVGTHHYSPHQTMPGFAAELERLGFRTTVINPEWDAEKDPRGLPGLEALADADVGVFFVRFLQLDDTQRKPITDFVESGKPVVCFRTSTHAFNYPEDHPQHGLNWSFGREAFGTPYQIHMNGQTQVKPTEGAGEHPILTGIQTNAWTSPGTLYLTKLEPGAKPLLNGTGRPGKAGVRSNQFGTFDLKEEMTDTIAWTWENQWGGRVFGTSLGHPGDFAVPESMRVMVNGVFWAAGKAVPSAETEIKTLGKSTANATPNKQPVSSPDDDTILFYGNSMIERLLEQGELEARLQIAQPKAGLKIRSLAWTGDEVGNRLRLEGYAQHMKNLLAEWPARTIVLGYGLNESFAGEAGLAEFRKHYTDHLNQFAHLHPSARFVLLSPIAIEGASETRQAEVERYSQAIAELAAEHGAAFVDLFTLTRQAYAESAEPRTENGIHLDAKGNSLVAKTLAQELLVSRGLSASEISEADPAHLREVALAAAAKHRRVAEVVRPKNAVVYFGVRARPDEYADEMPRYHEMIRLTEDVVHQIAANPKLAFADLPAPSLPPMPEGKGRDDGARTGIIKTVAESMAEFTTAPGYAVSLFASEEQFPELRNPVQIAFDARGRLWVVTMPSFPHTVPGLTPPDKIIILEDTNRDGKADKLTPFVEGLDALDGIAFHHDGVIISEQPRLWLMQDTDGDDRADVKRELLRGIDVTDSHHGGMIATDPMGAVIFSDGVFHRSQLETPFGVHRGMDATTYRLDMRTGKIITEWQHTTPNPWNVTFDRWGNLFQIYGDGDVYDGGALIWTPLGAYHPYAYARITSYGKGSGCAMISSPNFPDDYQNGFVSASLLGRYAVTLSKLNRDGGMVKLADSLTILESPNAAFRPADVEFGMDGSLYVSDFCSPIIGHAQHPMRDPHWDHDYGRIWRLVHTEKPLNDDRPKIEGASVEALCALLTHPQDLVRHHARIELRKHGAQGLQAVDQWIAAFDRTDGDFDQAALEAIFLCEGLGEVRPALIDHLIKSKSDLYRAAAIHVIRIQADRLANVTALLASVVNDPHPRVQVEVIDAVAHLRPTHPEVESVLTSLVSEDATVRTSLTYLDYGTQPAKGRSVPVLEVAKDSQLTHWIGLGEDGEEAPVEYQVGKGNLPGVGLFRTFVHSDQPQPAIIAINHKSLEIRLNDSLVFSQDSLWSGDQQVNVELKEGRNVIEILLKKGRRAAKTMPPAFLYDPVGQALTGGKYANDLETLRSSAAQYDQFIAERGNVIHVQAAAGLQFSPTKLWVTPGSKVRLIFDNPDIMMHNWVLLQPGSVEEVGALADQLAAQADGIAKGYLPESDKILQASNLLAPKETQEIVFDAPTVPGEYPYICTFPGHWRIMKGVLSVGERKVRPAAKSTTAAPRKAVMMTIGEGVIFETASSAEAFSTLVPPSDRKENVSANKKTNNDLIVSLTDGELKPGFGPIFGNGVADGAYKMDLGKPQSVTAITSWSHDQAGKRGAQYITLYGSADAGDPGWDVTDATHFTPLGTISTEGQSLQKFTALSRRSADGKPLGTFQWIVWQVAPISEQSENTAFQELSVEVSP